MTFPVGFHQQYLQYFLKRDVTKLYIAILIRNLALGMVTIFEGIYLYLYFAQSLPATLLYYGVMFGGYGLIAPFGGMAMAKLGARKSVLISYGFLLVYYGLLFFLDVHIAFVAFAVAAGTFSMFFFWPTFHTDFARFSSKGQRGRESGRVNIAMLVPSVIAPIAGGLILAGFGFPVLFLVVGVVLFASAVPLFFSKEHVAVYTDSYHKAWKRVFIKGNGAVTFGLFSQAVESGIYFFLWPLFLFTIAISFSGIGGIVSFALIASAFLMLYMGKLSDTAERPWVLSIASVWMSIAWVLQYFVTSAFGALLAHSIYMMSRAAVRVPFLAFFYERAAAKGEEVDEFVIYNEIVVNGSIGLVFVVLAGVFWVFPILPMQAAFLVAAVLALGISFIGAPPKIQFAHP